MSVLTHHHTNKRRQLPSVQFVEKTSRPSALLQISKHAPGNPKHASRPT